MRFYFRKDTGKYRNECSACQYVFHKIWMDDNPQKSSEYSKRWRDNHPDEKREDGRRYRKANPEKTREKSRRAYARHPEKYRQWSMQSRNPEKHRINQQRREANKRQLLSTFTNENWQSSLIYFDGRCAVCGRPIGLWHTLAQDHWIPLSKGGCYTAANIVPLCHGINGCNNSKKDRDPYEWLTKRFGPRKAKQITKRIQEYFEWVKHNHD